MFDWFKFFSPRQKDPQTNKKELGEKIGEGGLSSEELRDGPGELLIV